MGCVVVCTEERKRVPWNKEKELVQLQLEEEWKNRLERLAKVDERTRAGESVWLLKQGIQRREKELELARELDSGEGQGPTSSAGAASNASGPSGSRKATREFRQASILAWVVAELHESGRAVSRFRAGKMIYLIERGQDLGLFQHYLKQAAGPYDPQLRYGGPEKIAVEDHQWLRASDESHFEPGPNVEKGIRYAERFMDAGLAGEVLGHFKKYSNGALERWTTVDMASREIASGGGAVTVESVLAYIEATPEWAAKLERTEFEPEKVGKALVGLRKHGLIDEDSAG